MIDLLTRRRAMMVKDGGSPTPSLPSGYTQLNYIENIDKAYFSLPPIDNTGTTAEIYFAPNLGKISGGYACIIGANSNLQISFLSNGKASIGNATSANAVYTNGVVAKINVKFGDATTSYYKVDDVDTGIKRASSEDNYLFTSSAASYYARGKMYSLKMWNVSGVLIHDFVPCKNPDNIYGMYDVIGEKFYSSSNSGSAFIGN